MSPASGDLNRCDIEYRKKVSIQLMSPASGDVLVEYKFDDSMQVKEVSIQLMSPASGDRHPVLHLARVLRAAVSIQLMSPASGDSDYIKSKGFVADKCFHSINVPSEWGLFVS
jgi:hypothetical protein